MATLIVRPVFFNTPVPEVGAIFMGSQNIVGRDLGMVSLEKTHKKSKMANISYMPP